MYGNYLIDWQCNVFLNIFLRTLVICTFFLFSNIRKPINNNYIIYNIYLYRRYTQTVRSSDAGGGEQKIRIDIGMCSTHV